MFSFAQWEEEIRDTRICCATGVKVGSRHRGSLQRGSADVASGRPEGLPALAKMARQYLGRPASSAGVERMFSKAGKLYSDDKKGQEDDTLEAMLFASANAD